MRGWLRAALLPLAVAGVAAGTSACGDALLPSDYAGPPAANVTGNVFAWAPTDKVAMYPALSLEWLGTLDTTTFGETKLFSQNLRFVRSTSLDKDWDIDLVLPDESALLERSFNVGRVRFSVGKVVYFDDRARDGHVDWACGKNGDATGCDVVKAVSSEFVVFLESAPTGCAQPGAIAKPEIDRGFHYFRLDGGLPRELGANEAIGFAITDRSPAASDPRRELRLFAELLLTMWRFDTLQGCY